MRLKKIAAVIAAAAMAVSITAVNAFAAVTNYPDGYSLELAGEGYDLTAVYGFSAQLSGDYAGDSGCGGCMAFMSVSTDWEQHEFGNDGSGKEIITTEDGVITILKTSPVFKASDEYGQVCIQSWWGGDFAVDSVTILGKDGKALTAGGGGSDAAPADKADEAAPAGDAGVGAEENAPEAVDEEDVSDEAAFDEAAPEVPVLVPAADDGAATTSSTTGNVPAAVMMSVMAVAGAAAIAAKKRK